MSDEDALQGAAINSGDESGTPVHRPTIPDDEGDTGDGTGEGDAGPASGTTASDGDAGPASGTTASGGDENDLTS